MSTLADIASFSIKKTGIFQGSISDRDGPKKAKSCSMVDTYLKRVMISWSPELYALVHRLMTDRFCPLL